MLRIIKQTSFDANREWQSQLFNQRSLRKLTYFVVAREQRSCLDFLQGDTKVIETKANDVANARVVICREAGQNVVGV